MASTIHTLYQQFGSSDYIGEGVTQLEHGLQCAYAATLAGASEDVVLAALLHDVGHLLALRDHLPEMPDGLGCLDHERVGGEYLCSLGFGPVVCELVRRHVEAKRYLTWKSPDYFLQLSEASKGTLTHQGGPMSDWEAQRFEGNCLMGTILQMRQWDEAAKVEDWVGPDWSSYQSLICEHLSSQLLSFVQTSCRHF
jgi:predicted HD phosphohydrolase